MKKVLLILALALTCGTLAASCAEPIESKMKTVDPSLSIDVNVNGTAFTATLVDNAATQELVQHLPLTLTMSELHGNEKYNYLDFTLPTSPYNPGTISAGDIMLWGNDCLVVFYETFTTSYSYTRIGQIDNPEGLAEAAGSGSATVTFRLSANPTAIDRLRNDTSAATTVCNLQGVVMGKDLDALPAGIYIVNGKKIMKR